MSYIPQSAPMRTSHKTCFPMNRRKSFIIFAAGSSLRYSSLRIKTLLDLLFHGNYNEIKYYVKKSP